MNILSILLFFLLYLHGHSFGYKIITKHAILDLQLIYETIQHKILVLFYILLQIR